MTGHLFKKNRNYSENEHFTVIERTNGHTQKTFIHRKKVVFFNTVQPAPKSHRSTLSNRCRRETFWGTGWFYKNVTKLEKIA